jgi:hypothetical protein
MSIIDTTIILFVAEDTMIAPRVAVDNPDKVKGIVLMSAVVHSLRSTIFQCYSMLRRC